MSAISSGRDDLAFIKFRCHSLVTAAAQLWQGIMIMLPA
jgi:hypothetical protein